MRIAMSDQEIQSCFPVMKQLRPNLQQESFLQTIRAMQTEGYQMGYIKVDSKVVAVAGFRICINLAAEGKALYFYDLVTCEQFRSRGPGR